MAKWTNAYVGFDTSDETLNFGTRAVAVSDGNIYESATLAIIQTEEEKEKLKKNVQCNAIFSYDAGVIVTSDRSLTILHYSFSEILLSVHFEASIECIELSQNQDLIFCGLSDGTLVCLVVANEKKILFSKYLLDEESTGKHGHFARITSKCTEELFEVYIFLKNGSVLKAYHDDMKQLIELGSQQESCNIADSIAFSVSNSYDREIVVSQFFTYEGEDVVFMIKGSIDLCSYNGELDTVLEDNGFRIKKVLHTPESELIVCLSDDGYLLIFCGYTLLEIKKWEVEKVKDFTLLENGGNQINKTTSDMIILTDAIVPEICLVELPALEIKLRLKVAPETYLVEKQLTSEDIIYIEGFGEDSQIDTLRIKGVVECSPDFRLERLLQRCKFSAAEQFAQNFGISLEEVYKAKVQWLMDKLSFNKNHDLFMDYFNELMSLLEKIESVEFIAECCLKVIAPDLKMIQHLFNYANERLRKHTNKSDNILLLMDMVTKSNITLGTYIQVNDDITSPENWLIFSKSNPIMICRNLLLRGEIQKAVVVCRRHRDRIQNELPTEVAEELFQEIPTSLPVDEVLKWLRAYLPVLVVAHPNLNLFVSWVINRTKSLELDTKTDWLEKGLQFVNEVIEVLSGLPVKDDCVDVSFSLQDAGFGMVSCLNPLYLLARHLYQLHNLKATYNITMGLEEYLQAIEKPNGNMELIFLVLSEVGENILPTFIPGFFTDFCAMNYLEKDFVLFSYVNKMAKQSSSWWDIESAWESKAIAFISYIQCMKHKMGAIVTTAAKVTVPWSAEMKLLADKAMKTDHPLAQQVYNESKRVPMRLILKKYGLSYTGDIKVHRLIRYLYKMDSDSMIDDAKSLADSGHPNEELLPYFIYLLHSIELREIENALQLIKAELDKEQIIKVTQWTISYLMTLLQYRNVKAEDAVFDAIPTVYSTLIALNPQAAGELEHEIRLLCSFRALKLKYKLDLSLSVLHKPQEDREQFLRDYIGNLSDVNESNISKLAEDSGEIAFLLNLPRDFSLLELSYFYAAKENPSMSVQFLRLLQESEASFFSSWSSRLLKVISILLNSITNGKKVESSAWDTIQCVLRKVNLFSDEKDSVRSVELLSLAKFCSQPKSIVSTIVAKQIYTEQFEAPFSLPPKIYCQRIIQGHVSSPNHEPPECHNDVEKSLLSMPNNLSSIYRLQTVLWNLLSREELLDPEKMMDIIKEKVLNVLVRVVFSRNLDLKLALGLLGLLPIECGMVWLQNYISPRRENWANLKNASSIALVGTYYVTLTNHWNQWNLQKTFSEHYLKFECFRRLQRFGIIPKVAENYCETREGKKTLLLKLMTFPEVNVTFLQGICRDLNFDFQECLRLYLEHTLLTWEVRYEESTNPKTGKHELMLLSKKEDIALKCSQIEALTVKKDGLVDYLKKNILPRVNLYYYEVFKVIIDMIIFLSPSHQDVFSQHLLLLSFLLSYRRISPVSSDETDNWFHLFPDLSTVPRIAKYRLPFTPLPSDPWKIIKPELSLKTYKIWLNAPMWLNVTLEKDIICSFTIMNLKGEVPNNSEWNLHFQHESLMIEISECISRIQNIETAVAASYCVVNFIMPPGADRVDAAQKCFLKAQEWMALEHSEGAKIGLVKAEKKYWTVSTYHFLYKYQLAKPEYLALSHQPVDLISALYRDPSILVRRNDLSAPLPDINKAVARIASIHDVNLAIVLKELLAEWLQPQASLNFSFEDISIIPTTSILSENIIRASYVLTGFKNMLVLENFLLSIAFGQDTHTKSIGTRLRALQCLRAANSSRELEKLAARDMSSIEDLMLSLEMISYLEAFALDYTVQEFNICFKEDIVETLLKRSCRGAIALSAKICVTYHVWSAEIWNSLLSSMASLCMIDLLKYCLPEVAHLVNHLDETVFKNAWECLIFTTLNHLRNESDISKEVEQSFSLIESCPIMTTLDLSKIITIYEELNFPELSKSLAKFI